MVSSSHWFVKSPLVRKPGHQLYVFSCLFENIAALMRPYFHIITEENKSALNKPSNQDQVFYSELNSWYTENSFRSFCLKYVIDQRIYYKAGNREHVVNSGNLLLGCKQPYVHAYFESKQKVRSICIDICPATVSEAFTLLVASKDPDFDNFRARHFQTPCFFEAVWPAGNTIFESKLKGLVNAIAGDNAGQYINREWFLDLAEKIIVHEYGNYIALKGIRSVRLETRKELLRRLTIAKQYIDDCFLHINGIHEVAGVCNMSEFHFFRSFKQAFRLTPYQYLLKKRLLLARSLIAAGGMSLTGIAAHCSFPDVYTFSKAYKREFGFPPSHTTVVDM